MKAERPSVDNGQSPIFDRFLWLEVDCFHMHVFICMEAQSFPRYFLKLVVCLYCV